jgi:hypothetical protein
MSLKTRELHGTSGGRKDLRITGQQKSVEAMLRLEFIRSVKIPQSKVIHTSLTELTAFYFWSGEFNTRLNLKSEVLGLYESEKTWESLAFETQLRIQRYYSTRVHHPHRVAKVDTEMWNL